MWKATIRGLLARKVRLALTALAIVLGVSFVSGTYALTDTLDRSFDSLFGDTVANVDLVVKLQGAFGSDENRLRFPEAVASVVAATPGVRSAVGVVQGYAQFVDRDGESIQTGAAPTLGLSWSQRGSDGPLRLVQGRPPRRDGEVAMDAGTATDHGFGVGDRVRVLLRGPAEDFRIVGLFGLGDRTDFGSVTFAAFDLATAQRVFDAPRVLDAVNVGVARGGSFRAVQRSLEARLGPGYDVLRAAQVADETARPVRDFLALLTQLLLGFAAIGLVVGAFIIFNTFTILVAQRTRELGLLRAMGASGRQVVWSVVGEAVALGAAASAAGVLVGVLLADALLWVVDRFGFEIPTGPTVVLGRTVVVAMTVGTLVTVVASIVPARRAARVAPIVAIADVPPAPGRSLRRRAAVGAAVLVVGLPVLVVGVGRARDAVDVIDEIWIVALGALLVFLGVVLLLAAFARPLARAVGAPADALGITGELSRENAMRNPRRTAATASALVIGLGLVGLVAVFGDSAKASVREAVDRGIRADVVLKAESFARFSPDVAARLRDAPGIEGVASFRFGDVRVGGDALTSAGVDPVGLVRTVDLSQRDSVITGLGDDGVLLHEDIARDRGLHVGDPVDVQMPRGYARLRLAGTYGQRDFVGGLPVDVILTTPTYERGFGTTDARDALVYVAGSGGPATTKVAVERALGDDFPNIQVLTRDEYRREQERAINRFLAVTVALLLLSEIIAVLGIVNTLALSVHERTHELGLMRAVGMTRRQMRRMIRGESVIVAAIGGVVGVAVGLLWGWAFTASLRSQGLTQTSIPVAQLGVFVVLSMLAGVAAAVVPAWRASRLDVLDAIAAE